MWMSIAGGVVAAIVIVLLLFFNRGVEVIDPDWMDRKRCEAWANENGLMLKMSRSIDDDFEAGKIISQSAYPRVAKLKGEFISVVSLGHDLSVTLPLPDFMSMTKEE